MMTISRFVLFLLIFIVQTLSFTGCRKNKDLHATVIRDCTGTYIRSDGKDFLVCNPEKVAQFSDGTQVSVSFKKLIDCNGSAKDAVVCLMYHENEGWIEVERIN